MKTIQLLLRAERIKVGRTFAFWLSLLFPLFTVTLITLSYLNFKIIDSNPWIRFSFNLNNTLSFFLPFFLVILISYTIHLEHKSNAWKHLLSQPVSRLHLFLAKLGMVLLLVVFSYLMTLLFSYGASWLLHGLNPEKFHYQEGGIPFGRHAGFLLKTFLSSLFIISFQYWMSIRFKNLLLPIVLGISFIILPITLLIIMGMSGLLDQPKSLEHFFKYDPYAYPFAHIFNLMKGPEPKLNLLPELSLVYLLLATLVSFLSFLEFRKRNI